jgi:hypothetical protein
MGNGVVLKCVSENQRGETTVKKTKTLRLTSRAKSPKRPAKKVEAAPATDLKAMLQVAVEAATAAAPIVPGLDSDAGVPADLVGEPVKRAKAKAKQAPKAPKLPEAGVMIERQPGRGWFHVVIDCEHRGVLFQSTRHGRKIWVGEAPDRAIRAEGSNRRLALDAWIAAYRSA